MKFFALILLQLGSIQNRLVAELNSFQQKPSIKHGIVAASVQRISDGKSIIKFNDEKAVNSASTLKLITTATALSVLKPDYRFVTEVGYTGNISGATLNGDILILPSGDPSLGSERGNNPYDQVNQAILKAIKNLGINKITGNIIIRDESIFDYDLPDSWIWGDIGNYYGAIPHKFNIHENFYKVFFEPGKSIGSDASINSVSPFDSDWRIINKVKTGSAKSGDQVYIYASPSSEVLLMKGTVPLGKNNFVVKGAIPEPAKLFRKHLIFELNKNKIEVLSGSQDPQPDDLTKDKGAIHIIHRFYSQPLSELARDCNFFSINLYADAFLHQLNGKGFNNFETGIEALKKYWTKQGIQLSGFNPRDGSGLSQAGVITANNMTEILCAMAKKEEFESFYHSIAILGKDGSMRYKDRKNLTGGRVRAKSGYISGTRAYAGYFDDKTGERYAYMLCINRYEPNAKDSVRAFLDNFLVKMGSS